MELAFVVITGWLVCVCVHEFGHALIAYLGGDETVNSRGYLSLNLLRYIDPTVTFLFPAIAMAMGWIALPGAAVYINHANLRNRGWRSAVAAAGPVATLLCTWILSLFISQHWFPLERSLKDAIAVIILFNIASTFLNLLPVPPLDGFGIIEPWLTSNIQQSLRRIPAGAMLLGVMIFLGYVEPARDALWGGTFLTLEWLDVPKRYVRSGYTEFMQNSVVVVGIMLCGLLVLSRTRKTSNPVPTAASSDQLQEQAVAKPQLTPSDPGDT